MTPRERVKAAMDLRQPDRVPVMCQLSIGHMLLQLGVPPVEFWHDPELFADGLVKLRAQYDFDGILVSLHGHNPEWRREIDSRRASDDGEIVTFTDGHEMMYPPDDLPRPPGGVPRAAKAISEFDTSDLPPVLSYIPVSGGLHFQIHPDHKFDIFGRLRAAVGPEYSLHGEITSPFDYFLDLFGYQEGLINLIDDPQKSKSILSHFAHLVSDLAAEMCDSDIDAIKVSSPFAGGGFISRAFYEEFILPYESEIIGAVRKKGVHIYIHTCGAIGDRLDLMFDSGASGLECLDPPPLGNVELAEAMKTIGGRGFVKGNVDSVNLLLMKGRKEIMEDLKERIRIGKGEGGFILSTACSVAPRVKKENMLLFRDAVGEWG